MLLSRRTGETFAAIQESSDQFLGQRRPLLAPRLSRRCQNHLLRCHGLGVELEHHLLYFSGGRSPTSWSLGWLARGARCASWDCSMVHLQGLEGQRRPGPQGPGVGCGADNAASDCKDNSWLPKGWISWVSNAELLMERPEIPPRSLGNHFVTTWQTLPYGVFAKWP